MKIPKHAYKLTVALFLRANVSAVLFIFLMWVVSKYITGSPFKGHLVLPIFLLMNVVPTVVSGRLLYGFLIIKTPKSPEEVERHKKLLEEYEQDPILAKQKWW